MARVPARYVGAYPVNLRQIDGMQYDAEGRPITSYVLNPGDTMMVQAQEAFGQTLKWDPTGREEPLYLGVGRVVLPEHEGLPDHQLAQLGYEFQGASRNWLALVAPSRGPVPASGPGEAAEPTPLGTDAASAQLEALVQQAAADAAQTGAPELPAPAPTPEELADRAFRRKPRTAAQAEQAAAIKAQEERAAAAQQAPADAEETPAPEE